jgi:glycerophosphoryl diester phosphodiesterase
MTDGRMTELHGHRGARGLFPENTREGFAAAWALGVDFLELDVHLTADGVVAVHHDFAPNPDIARDERGAWLAEAGPALIEQPMRALTTLDVGRLRPGSALARAFPDQTPHDGARIPTLAEVLALDPAMRLNIEIKRDPRHPDASAPTPVLAEAVADAIAAADAGGRVRVQSFDWSCLRWLRARAPALPLAWLTREAWRADAALWWDRDDQPPSTARAVADEGSIWAPEYVDLTERAVGEAHALGLRVTPWTVNEIADMERLLAWGVDGLITDRPDRARALLPRPDRATP